MNNELFSYSKIFSLCFCLLAQRKWYRLQLPLWYVCSPAISSKFFGILVSNTYKMSNTVTPIFF